MAIHQRSWTVYFTHCYKQIFVTLNVKTVNYGLAIISDLGPKIWSILPNDFKLSTNLFEFQTENLIMETNKRPLLGYVEYMPLGRNKTALNPLFSKATFFAC